VAFSAGGDGSEDRLNISRNPHSVLRLGRAYFATAKTRELEEALNRSIGEVALLTCSLIARYVLYSRATESKRRQRLSNMGFDASGRIDFGANQWVITILAVIALSVSKRDSPRRSGSFRVLVRSSNSMQSLSAVREKRLRWQAFPQLVQRNGVRGRCVGVPSRRPRLQRICPRL
jgi:hypothetical protein